MFKSLMFAIIAVALVLSPLTAEAKAKKNKGGRAALLGKYDTDKDGKLSKAERSRMTPEDRAMLGGKKKKS